MVEGRAARLTIGGSVAPAGDNFPLLIQWQKDGVDIPGATSSDLVLRNAGAANRGVDRAITD